MKTLNYSKYEYYTDGSITKNGKPVAMWKDKDGYLICKIDGKNKRVHRLIAYLFIYNPDNLATVNHKDGNKLNNHVSNLEWMTFSDNAKHSWANGLARPCKGEKHGRSKLTQEQVEHIRSLPMPARNGKGDGITSVSIAKEYGMSAAQIRRIRKGLYWNDSDSN